MRKRGESASSGTGTRISTLLAVERRLNWARAWIEGVISDSGLSLEELSLGGLSLALLGVGEGGVCVT